MNVPDWIIVLTASSLICLAGAWFTTSICRLSAAWNHLCWLLALAIPMFALVVFSTGWRVELPVLPTMQPVNPPVSEAVFEMILPENEATTRLSEVFTLSGSVSTASEMIFGLLWSLGCLVVVGFLALFHFRLHQKLRHVRDLPVSERILAAAGSTGRRFGIHPKILICDFTDVPFCYGILRPHIALPRQAAEWSDEILRACLAHEFAHLRRHDLLSLALAQLGCAVVWFNPMVWFGLNRLRAAAECAADDIAVEQAAAPQTYASQLLAVAAQLKESPFTAVTFPMARAGQLRQRIESVMDEKRRRKSPSIWGVISLGGISAFLLTAGLVVELVAAEPESTTPQSDLGKRPTHAPDPRLSLPHVASKTMPLPGEIVAFVNDIPITRNQLEEAVRPKAKAGAPSEDLMKQSLNDLIDRLLLLQEWDRLNVKGANIPQSVIEDRINSIVSEEFGGDREKFLQTIKKNGYTLEGLREYELIKIQMQAVKQAGIRNMFKDGANYSGEDFRRQREAWMKSLRDQARIEYLLPQAGPTRLPSKKVAPPSPATVSKSPATNLPAGTVVAFIDDHPVNVPRYVARKADFNPNEAVDTELLSRLWKQQKGVVDEWIIDDRINSVVEQEFSGSLEKFENFLGTNGSSLKEFRSYEEKKIAAQGARLILRGKVGSREEQLKKVEDALKKIRPQSVIKLADTKKNLNREASGIAAKLANNTAFQNFGIRPFRPSDGSIVSDSERWTWTASKGFGYSDLVATVVYETASLEPSIEVSQRVNLQW